jgi:hypothetical protein
MWSYRRTYAEGYRVFSFGNVWKEIWGFRSISGVGMYYKRGSLL